MAGTATISKMSEDFTPDARIQEYLEELSATELRQLASYARKMAAGKEDPHRKPGGEGGRWLTAQYVHGSGPYFYLHSYSPAATTRTDDYGFLKSGSTTTKYIGRRLPMELAEEFGYPEGATPEETSIRVTGTHRERSSRKQNSE